MAESLSPRFGVKRWSTDLDTPTREDFDEAHRLLDLLAAIDLQGTRAVRPAPGRVGTYYFATDENLVYRDNGTGWVVVGSLPSDDLPSVASRTAGISLRYSRGDHSHGPSSTKGFTMTMMGA